MIQISVRNPSGQVVSFQVTGADDPRAVVLEQRIARGELTRVDDEHVEEETPALEEETPALEDQVEKAEDTEQVDERPARTAGRAGRTAGK